MPYHFSYSAQGAYGHVVGLVDGLALRPSAVLDLGCGYGAVAEPLAERGWRYVGVDVDPEAVGDLRRRGFEAHVLDLWGSGPGVLTDQLVEVAGGRPVGAVLLLDVVEHCPSPDLLLADVATACRALGGPVLVVSIPNVAHVDVVAKLLGGEFEYTATGLLDRTHLQLWTERRVVDAVTRHGWLALGQHDVVLRHSDQFDPDDPLQAEHSPLAAWIRQLRERAGSAAYVNQFVRAFALGPPPGSRSVPAAPARTWAAQPGGPSVPPPSPTFLTVIVRTRGDRMAALREALLCLAAQSDDDFAVELVVHHPDPDRRRTVERLVAEFAPDAAARVRVHACSDGGRARPLNVGLDAARGDYVAFLDDDDLITADWVATFRQAATTHPGCIVRSLSVQQDVVSVGEPPDRPYAVRSPFRAPYHDTFDLIEHLVANQTPIHTFALPRRLVTRLSLRFDESLAVTEDWDLLLRAAQVAEVVDTGRVTGVYHWWLDGSGSAGVAPPEVWTGTRQLILERLTAQPVLLPPAAARRLVAWAEEHAAERAARQAAEDRAADAAARLEAMRRSRVWRLTAPLRTIAAGSRRVVSRVAGHVVGRVGSVGRAAPVPTIPPSDLSSPSTSGRGRRSRRRWTR